MHSANSVNKVCNTIDSVNKVHDKSRAKLKHKIDYQWIFTLRIDGFFLKYSNFTCDTYVVRVRLEKE